MENKSIALKALEYAMSNERLGWCFYTRAAEKTTDDTGKKMFISLASDEEEHLSILQKQYDSLEKSNAWISIDDARKAEPPSCQPTLFPEEEAKVEGLVKKRASDLDALDIALDMERRGYKQYVEEAEKTNDLTAKAVYEYLSKEEDRHFTMIQKTREYLASSGAWLWDELHPPMLDG